MFLRSVLVLLTAAFAAPVGAQAVWGSFDSSRVALGQELATSPDYEQLRSVLDASPCVLAPPASALTPAYLADVDVFFTSALEPSTGVLSAAEQDALRAWIAEGGTLVVTGSDDQAAVATQSFSEQFGVTGWRLAVAPTIGRVVGVHPVTEGVATYRFAGGMTFDRGPDARMIGEWYGRDFPFLAVLEPATGFALGGRILAVGSHSVFLDSYLGLADNRRLAGNVARWTASSARLLWGSFDATRVGHAGALLTTGDYRVLRAKIAVHDGLLAPPTPELTPAYLGAVDVFYTSLLGTTSGVLSAAEQTALRDWIAAGGTLIVTGDAEPLAACESFTAQFGVTSWRAAAYTGFANIVREHPVTVGVSSFRHDAFATFDAGASGSTLASDVLGNPLLWVGDPASGFDLGGRILVLGDHDVLTDALVGYSLLADNIARWAGAKASWDIYGRGWPGTLGVPELTMTADPWLGTTPALGLRGSNPDPSFAWIAFGTVNDALSTGLGGQLWLRPDVVRMMPVLTPELTRLPLVLPAELSMLRARICVQLLQQDPGASHGYAFSRGLRMVLGW